MDILSSLMAYKKLHVEEKVVEKEKKYCTKQELESMEKELATVTTQVWKYIYFFVFRRAVSLFQY